MGGIKWEPLEEIIVVFLVSRGVIHAACGDIIQRRIPTAEHRGTIAVRSKLAEMRGELKDKVFTAYYEEAEKKWLKAGVDEWLASLNLTEEELNIARLEIDDEDLRIISGVSQVLR
jgi:hypothetical protein